MPMRAAIGLRVHSGWAALVTVAGSPQHPTVLHRRRIELADPSIKGSVQPYHAAKVLALEKAQDFLDRCAKASEAMAKVALSQAIREHAVAACGILTGSGRPGGTLETILRSHAAIHSAEGEFFRAAIVRAASACGLPCRKIREKELLETAHNTFLVDVTACVDGMRKMLGTPWRQDEKFAAIAGWLALRD